MIMLETIELSIGYHSGKKNRTIVFGNINLGVSKGELVALIGPNGSGKSTLLRTISRLQAPLSGGINLCGNDLKYIKHNKFAEMLSFVSTEPIQISKTTVYQVVALGRFPYTNWLGQLSEEDKIITTRAIHQVGLESMADRFINDLSDGEKQRAMIARALAQDTSVIILDEPTAFLDLKNKYEIVHLLSDLALHNSKTIVFSTHDLNIAISIADKIWLMRNDIIIQGAPEDLIHQQAFNGLFGEDMHFDWQTGIFKRTKKSIKNVQVLTEKLNLKKLTLKALDRIGYGVNNFSEIKISPIEMNNSLIWKVENKTKVYELDNIYSLCWFLRNEII